MGSAPSAKPAESGARRELRAHAVPPKAGETANPASRELAELRRILVGEADARLDELQARLDDPKVRADEVAAVLAEAIAIRTRADEEFQRSLYPTIEEAVRVSVARHPHVLAESLFPIIGEAVRKSVAHALRSMVESLNLMLERSVSWESVKWRFEALRTGKTFGEIALMRSLRYRVEQVFLIHRETGLLLQHASARGEATQDNDVVSGMLTAVVGAVKDFVHDSFGAAGGQSADDLDTMQVGQCTVWVQHGPTALLAAAVTGTAPPELRNLLQRELELIHRDFGGAISAFEGDAAALAGTRANLERCLLGRDRIETKPSYRWAWALGCIVLAIAALGVVQYRGAQRWAELVRRIGAEPGFVVVEAQRHWRGYELAGMRDPLAADPAALIAAAGIDPARVAQRWEPYQSLDARFAFLRQVASDKQAIEATVLRFPLDSTQLTPDQVVQLQAVETQVRRMELAARVTGQAVRIEIYGHTDATGAEGRNAVLSQHRADAVVQALAERGIAPALLSAVGVADAQPEHRASATYPGELNRRVTFRVVLASQKALR